MISNEDERETRTERNRTRRTSKGKVMIYILSKLEYFFTHYFLLQSGNVTVDCPQTCCVFSQEYKPEAFMWPSDFDKEME